jgi:hypothetical protein
VKPTPDIHDVSNIAALGETRSEEDPSDVYVHGNVATGQVCDRDV